MIDLLIGFIGTTLYIYKIITFQEENEYDYIFLTGQHIMFNGCRLYRYFHNDDEMYYTVVETNKGKHISIYDTNKVYKQTIKYEDFNDFLNRI
jgi:hypothetical protein